MSVIAVIREKSNLSTFISFTEQLQFVCRGLKNLKVFPRVVNHAATLPTSNPTFKKGLPQCRKLADL